MIYRDVTLPLLLLYRGVTRRSTYRFRQHFCVTRRFMPVTHDAEQRLFKRH